MPAGRSAAGSFLGAAHTPFAVALSRSQSWLRASVLGANDGILSTASFIAGVAAAHPGDRHILVAGLAAAVAGALSMAAGEYVSVSSQADSEKADIASLDAKIKHAPDQAMASLTGVFERQGLSADLARRVAQELSARDPLLVHAREGLNMSPEEKPRALQAAMASALSFISGASVPLAAMLLGLRFLSGHVALVVIIASMIALGILGGIGARLGGAPIPKGVVRVMGWGAMAMLVTALVGHFFGGGAG